MEVHLPCSKDLGGDRLPGLKGRDMDKVLSSGGTGIKWSDGVEILYTKPLIQKCSCLKDLQGQNWRRT